MWKVVSCEAQGRMHLKNNIPCQDKTKCVQHNDISIIALADGAGSAKLSHCGAKCIVDNISVFVTEHFDELVSHSNELWAKQHILDEVFSALSDKAIELECDINDLSSTFLLAAANNCKYLVLHIGDGVIGVLKNNELTVASYPDNNEFANITTFTTSKDAFSKMRFIIDDVEDVSGFVIMSDGTEQSLYHKSSKTLAGAIVKLMQMTCLLNSKIMEKRLLDTFTSIIVPNTQDDCSIAILARPSGILKKYEDMSFSERKELFSIGDTNDENSLQEQLKRYESIIELLKTPMTYRQIANKLCIKENKAKKRLNHLVAKGLLTRQGNTYIASWNLNEELKI